MIPDICSYNISDKCTVLIQNIKEGGALQAETGCSIQSTSDQEDYVNYATITANAATAATAVTPEQAAVWSYPQRDVDKEEAIYNRVNTLFLRIHQSGHLAEISPERKALVAEGIRCYKEMRSDIRRAVPYWPLDLAGNQDKWVAAGVKLEEKAYLGCVETVRRRKYI